MHLFDQKKGILSSVPIVSSSIPVGVGAGFYLKYSKKNNIAVIFLGDAAIEEGVFYESLNYAKILSCLFCLCVKIIYFHASQI